MDKIVKIKIKHVGSNSLLGAFVQHLIDKDRLSEIQNYDIIQFYIEKIVDDINLVKEINLVKDHALADVEIYSYDTFIKHSSNENG